MTSQKGPVTLGSSLTLNLSTSYPEGLDWVDWGHQNASGGRRLDPYSLYLPHVTWGDAGNWSCTLYRNQSVVGHALVHLEVTDMAPLGSDLPTSFPGRATLVVLFTLLVLIVALSVLAIARKVKVGLLPPVPRADEWPRA
ncbi:hypothetical protein chiPu_0027113 [Chiloscyllium punctatum]|uniref:Immunoglobulin domain-containing protein n=1 Tax=Chiloscyllium punctatum TaxID=137246 RepID=A0A401TK37_CHIPU|nr:hypothetical protein [Chiloscyllium punctatum]